VRAGRSCATSSEIWPELAYYEDYPRFAAVLKILHERYGSKLKELRPTPASQLYSFGDQLMTMNYVTWLHVSLKEDKPTADADNSAANTTAGMPDNIPGAVDKGSMELTPQELATERAWVHFAHELSIALTDLKKNQYLIVSRASTNHYVQVMDGGSSGLRAESVSNTYLKDDEHLRDETTARLLELGWTAPAHPASDTHNEDTQHKVDNFSNFCVDLTKPIAYRQLADLIATTLRVVYRAEHPGGLQYDAVSTSGMSIQFPRLGIPRSSST
jgi:hypothetical protein